MMPLQSSHAVTDLERSEDDSVADVEVEISDEAEAAAEPPPVLLRGTRAGLEIVIDTRAPMSEIADELTARLEQSPGFFAGNDARVRVIGRLPVGALARLEEVTTRFALRILEIGPPPASTAPEDGDREVDVAAEPDAPAPAPAAEEPPPLPMPTSTPRMVIGPIRSGTTLDAPTDLIVVGDVNPGAEIHARGNIIVLGRLRGVAHAAVGGQSGFIFALRFEPQQLRIGRLVARAGESDAPGQGAEIAYATDRTIVVERYQGRLPSGLDAAA
jgi:septum site-determining protein MinC